MTVRARKTTPEVIAQNFARHAPIGTSCRYYPVLPCGEDDFHESFIRSEPWVVGKEVVVAIEGFSGGKSIKHIAFVRSHGELARSKLMKDERD